MAENVLVWAIAPERPCSDNPTRLANEKNERWQRVNLNLHLDEVVVEVKHGGDGNQAEISADSKDGGLTPYRKYSIQAGVVHARQAIACRRWHLFEASYGRASAREGSAVAASAWSIVPRLTSSAWRMAPGLTSIDP